MRKLSITIIFVVISFLSFAQTKNNVSVYYGIADNVKSTLFAKGGGGSHPMGSYSFELTYSHLVYKQLSVEAGFRYSKCKTEISFDFIRPPISDVNGNLYLISIPVNLKVAFWKYFFCHAGFTYDIDFNRDKLYPMEDQTGVGIVMGAGCRVDFKQLSFTLNPVLLSHSLVAFKQDNNKKTRLIELSLKFGIGYNF